MLTDNPREDLALEISVDIGETLAEVECVKLSAMLVEACQLLWLVKLITSLEFIVDVKASIELRVVDIATLIEEIVDNVVATVDSKQVRHILLVSILTAEECNGLVACEENAEFGRNWVMEFVAKLVEESRDDVNELCMAK